VNAGQALEDDTATVVLQALEVFQSASLAPATSMAQYWTQRTAKKAAIARFVFKQPSHCNKIYINKFAGKR